MKPASPEALINPKMLEWVRRQGAYSPDDMATKAHARLEDYNEWEQGSSRPTMTQLFRLAHGVHRPLTIFYFDSLPPADAELPDFRRLPSESRSELSAEARLELRKARERREEFIALAQQMGALKPGSGDWKFVGSATLQTPLKDLASHARSLLGVDWPPLAPLSSNHAIFNFWREALERAGILVFQGTIATDEFRAAAIAETPFPVILVSSSDFVLARVFSLLHELGHLLLGESNVSLVVKGGVETEAYCNRFAAEMLMPEAVFRKDPDVAALTKRTVTRSELRTISRRYGVSMQAAAVRLCDLKLQSPRLVSVFKGQFERETEASSGGGNYYATQIAQLGPMLISTTLRAVESDTITAMDAYRILGVKPGNLEQLRFTLGG